MSVTTETAKTYSDHQVLHVRDQADQASFFEAVKDNAARAKFQQQVRKLVIHLDARQLIMSREDKLVMALNCLHPIHEGADVINPHNLETICFVVDSDILFTRFSYSLTSPTLYNETYGRRARLLRNTLSPTEKRQIAFQVTSTEKLIAPALLGLRYIKNVVFDTTPRPCKLEGGFREMLELTLPCVPALTDNIPAPSHQSNRPYATSGFDREGAFHSAAYDAASGIDPYGLDEQLDDAHIYENNGFNLYNMVVINPSAVQKTCDSYKGALDSMPSVLQDVQLGWKV